jgi:5'-3' exonuclease
VSDVIGILDGDVFAHLACTPRWHDKVKIKDGATIFALDENGIKKEFDYTTEENAKYMEQSWDKFQNDIDKLMGKLFCGDYLMAVGRKENFRLDMYPDYKANRHKRKSAKVNPFVPGIRELAVYEGMAVMADNREADDYVRTWAEEARAVGQDFIICSVDKDLKCIPGRYYNIKHKKIETISEEYARRFYYEQLIAGDPTDKIPGLQGVGPVTATELLFECNTEEEFQKIVVELYKVYYDDHWKDYLLSNGKMIHIQKHLNDYFTLENWKI